MAKHPYVTRRGAVYYYRRKIPQDLTSHYAPKHEFVFSLKTKDRQEAVRKANVESVRIDREFAELRSDASPPLSVELSHGDIRQLVDEFRHRILREDEEVRFDGTGDADVYLAVTKQLDEAGVEATTPWEEGQVKASYGLSEREFTKSSDDLEFLSTHFRHALARGDISVAFDSVDELLDEQRLHISKDSDSYRTLAKEVLKAWVEVIKHLERRQRGELVETPPVGPLNVRQTRCGDAECQLSCSELWERYRDERKLPEKTASEFGAYVRRFIELVGDLPVAAVTKANARDYKDAMLKMPARRSAELLKMTVPEILAATKDQADLKRLSPKTVNEKAIGAVRAIFGYAVQNDYCTENPFSGIRAIGPASQEPSRVPYTIDDLRLIFSTPVFTRGERPRAAGGEAAKWLPLLALFTGARLEELGRLTRGDVLQEDDVNYLFIRAGSGGRKLKGKSSRRKVPIHSELERLGFLEYVASQRPGAGGETLWPALTSRQSEVTAGFSKWWGRYIRLHGIHDKRKVFHSFRHLVKRQLRNAGVDKPLVDAIQGHAPTDVADRVYGLDEEGFGISLPVLKNAIERLTYPTLDLSHIYPG